MVRLILTWGSVTLAAALSVGSTPQPQQEAPAAAELDLQIDQPEGADSVTLLNGEPGSPGAISET